MVSRCVVDGRHVTDLTLCRQDCRRLPPNEYEGPVCVSVLEQQDQTVDCKQFEIKATCRGHTHCTWHPAAGTCHGEEFEMPCAYLREMECEK